MLGNPALLRGLGTSHSRSLVRDDFSIEDLCLEGEENDAVACIKGALEFIGKYWEKKHVRICAPLAEKKQLYDKCIAAGEGGECAGLSGDLLFDDVLVRGFIAVHDDVGGVFLVDDA